jgi:O-antigen ligase
MSGYLVMMTFLVYGRLVVSKKHWEKAWYFLTLCVYLVGIITTSSRGAIIGLVGGGVLFFAIHPLTRAHFLRNTLVALLVLLASVLIAKPSFVDRMLIGFGYSGSLIFEKDEETSIDKAAERTGNISGMGQRYAWWKLGLKEMVTHPHKLLLGLGIGGFISYARAIHTHSAVLSFFFDMGLPGVLLQAACVVVLAWCFSRLLRSGKRDYAYFMFVGALVAFVAETAIHGLIDFDLYSYPAKMFWLPLGYVLAVYNLAMAGNPRG